MLIRLSGTEPGTEEHRRKVKRGGGGGGTSKQLKFRLPSPAQNCFRVCLSILQKVDHNRGVSALSMFRLRLSILVASPLAVLLLLKLYIGELKLGVFKFVY